MSNSNQLTQVVGYRLVCACYHSIHAMPAAGYAYACNETDMNTYCYCPK
ncbi:hypothetical protein [Nostoc sp.]